MLKERIAEGSLCQAVTRLRAKLGRHRLLAAAAEFLGLDRAELRAALPGTSLSSLAEKQGKSVAGLKAAMLAPVEAKLAKAVETNRISQEARRPLLDRVENRVDRLVAKDVPEPGSLRELLRQLTGASYEIAIGWERHSLRLHLRRPATRAFGIQCTREMGSGFSLTSV